MRIIKKKFSIYQAIRAFTSNFQEFDCSFVFSQGVVVTGGMEGSLIVVLMEYPINLVFKL